MNRIGLIALDNFMALLSFLTFFFCWFFFSKINHSSRDGTMQGCQSTFGGSQLPLITQRMEVGTCHGWSQEYRASLCLWTCDRFLQSDTGQAEFSHLGLDIIHVAKIARSFTLEINAVVHCQMHSCIVLLLHAVGC